MATTTAKRPQTNSAGVTSKDRTAAGPRADGGVGALPSEETKGWVPIGGIIIYSGLVANIPGNWHLCDGTEGTPNMVDRFVLGTATEAAIGTSGGSDTHQHAAGTLAVAAHTTANDTAVTGAGARATTANHVVSGNTADATTLPPWLKLAFIQRIT